MGRLANFRDASNVFASIGFLSACAACAGLRDRSAAPAAADELYRKSRRVIPSSPCMMCLGAFVTFRLSRYARPYVAHVRTRRNTFGGETAYGITLIRWRACLRTIASWRGARVLRSGACVAPDGSDAKSRLPARSLRWRVCPA